MCTTKFSSPKHDKIFNSKARSIKQLFWIIYLNIPNWILIFELKKEINSIVDYLKHMLVFHDMKLLDVHIILIKPG